MKNLFLLFILFTILIFSSCATTEENAEISVSPQKNVTKLKYEKKVNGEIVKSANYKAIFRNKNLVATGVFVHPNETIARNMSLNMAINNLAKSAGQVIQREDSTLYNDKVHMIIETKACNIVKGFKILSQKYDPISHRAETTIKMDGEELANLLIQEMEK